MPPAAPEAGAAEQKSAMPIPAEAAAPLDMDLLARRAEEFRQEVEARAGAGSLAEMLQGIKDPPAAASPPAAAPAEQEQGGEQDDEMKLALRTCEDLRQKLVQASEQGLLEKALQGLPAAAPAPPPKSETPPPSQVAPAASTPEPLDAPKASPPQLVEAKPEAPAAAPPQLPADQKAEVSEMPPSPKALQASPPLPPGPPPALEVEEEEDPETKSKATASSQAPDQSKLDAVKLEARALFEKSAESGRLATLLSEASLDLSERVVFPGMDKRTISGDSGLQADASAQSAAPPAAAAAGSVREEELAEQKPGRPPLPPPVAPEQQAMQKSAAPPAEADEIPDEAAPLAPLLAPKELLGGSSDSSGSSRPMRPAGRPQSAQPRPRPQSAMPGGRNATRASRGKSAGATRKKNSSTETLSLINSELKELAKENLGFHEKVDKMAKDLEEVKEVTLRASKLLDDHHAADAPPAS